MGVLSSLSLMRSRASKQKLPVYEPLGSPTESPSKERYSSESSALSESDDDDSDCSAPSSPSTGGSRQTSSSFDSEALMLPKRRAYAKANAIPPRRRPARPYFYRLPNKIVRYLCVAMIMTILLFIYSLIRASQVENRRIANGDIEKAAAPPPPWESFGFLTRYYGGVRSLAPFADSSPEYPLERDEQPYNATRDARNPPGLHSQPEELEVNQDPLPPSKPFLGYPGSVFAESQTAPVQCYLDREHKANLPPVRYFDGRPRGLAQSVMGSHELLSLPEDICFERYGRFGPYGFGYSVRSGGLGVGEHSEQAGAEEVWKTVRQVDWRKVDWADAQRRCFQANAAQFKPQPPPAAHAHGFFIDEEPEAPARAPRSEPTASRAQSGKEEELPASDSSEPAAQPAGDLPRTAVVLRCWDEFDWGAEDVMNLRALIAELSLASGGRYDVHLLVQVKNDAKHPIWADDEAYRARIRDAVPREFQGIVTLWSETQMLALYQGIFDLYTSGPDLPVHGVYRGLQMAMQHFAYSHPEYDYFWQWEMDIRYTGHYYDLLAKLESWAQEQPRKGLWERNARFYFPSVHGSWDDFRQMARVQTEMGTLGPDTIWGGVPGAGKGPHDLIKGEETVWGPVRPADPGDWFEYEDDPEPPTTYEKDRYVWGAGEEADYITLNPIFNPAGTTWSVANDITGYNESAGAGKPPRRAHIITASRMSRRLLLTMHRETAFKKHHAFSEMWPATVALQHGYKAVFVPHPVYVDREWPTQYMAQIFNSGKNGATGGSRTSVFGQREHNFQGVTWFYNAGFGPNLYRRWLGLRVNNDGGEQFETQTDRSKDDSTVGTMRGGEGRMCLPPMLLHPVKGIELPVEATLADEIDFSALESDPAA